MIGAIALVMLLVVFVPMLLDSEPRPARNEPTTTIPSRENAPPLPAPPAAVARAPAVAPAPDKSTRGQAPAGAESSAPAVAPAKAGAQSGAATEPQKAAAPPKTADAAKLEGFAVQVGAFRDEAKLKHSREKLAAAGVVHYTERLDSKGGALTRLRAGPFATRAEAEAALAKLKRAAIDGKVVPLP